MDRLVGQCTQVDSMKPKLKASETKRLNQNVINCFQYLLSISACAASAWGGNLEVLQWAREHGCEWDSRACMYAAAGGHLEVLQWVREQGGAWGDSTTLAAAECGHLEVLTWSGGAG